MDRIDTGMAPRSARMRASILNRRRALWGAGFVGLAAAVDVSWILREHRSPPWDQAHYLDVMWHYRTTLSEHGVLALGHVIRTVDPSHAPLFPVLAFGFSYLFGDGVRTALVLNLLLLPVVILSAGAVAAQLFGNRARLLTMFLVATTPVVVGLSHEVLQDFLLTTVVTVTLLLLLKSERFTRTRVSLYLGAAIGLGLLTKVTFLLYIVGPLAVVLVALVASSSYSSEPRWQRLRIPARNFVYTVAVAGAVAAPWYIVNRTATLQYLRDTTSGPLVIGVGPNHPFQIRAIVHFMEVVLEADLSWLFTILAALVLLVALPQLIAWIRRREGRRRKVEQVGFLVAWLSVPFWVFAFSQDQDVRYLGPVMPAVAILIAGVVTGLSAMWPRRLLVGALVVLGVFQTTLLTVDVRPPLLPSAVVVRAPVGVATIPLAGQPEGYERRPEPVDYAAPIVSYLVSKSQASNHQVLLRQVCILETDPVVNGNTLGWIADEHQLPFVFFDQFQASSSATVLAQLRSCDFALYIPAPKVNPALRSDRVVLLNQHSVAAMITPTMLAIFQGPSRRFPVALGADVYVLERESRGSARAASVPIGPGR